MARIPTYRRQVRPEVAGAPRVLDASVDTSGLARGVQNVASAIEQVHQQEVRDANQTAMLDADNRLGAWQNQTLYDPEKGMLNRKGSAALGITQSFLSDFDTQQQAISDSLANDDQRRMFNQSALSRRQSLQAKLGGYEFDQQQVYKNQVDEASISLAKNSAALNYNDPSAVAENRAKLEAVVQLQAQRNGWAPEVAEAYRQQHTSEMYTDILQRQVADDPYRAKKTMTQYESAMTADDIVRVGGMIDREIKSREIEARQMQAIARAELSSRVSDASAAYLAGFDYAQPPSRAEFIASYGAKEGDERFQQFQRTQSIGAAIQEIATADPEERARLVSQFDPAPGGVAGEGFQANSRLYGALINAAARLGKELQDDPAAYVAARAPLVQRAAQALESGDPAATEAYATATLAEQQRLGVAEPKLLTDQRAAAIAAGFSQTEDGGSNAAALVQQLQAQWGKRWPAVYRQLQGKLPGAALVIGTGVDQQTAATLARIAPVKTEDLQKGLSSTNTKAARDALNESMAGFRATLAGQVGGERTFATLYNEMERLTYTYMGQGKGPEDAAEQAYKSVVDDRYTITGTWRAPKRLNAGLIESGAERVVRSLDAGDLEFAVPPGVGEEFARNQVKKALESSGYWVTLPDESGLALYLGGSAVLDKSGAPITRSWDDLAGEAATQKGPTGFELRRRQ